MTDAATSRQVFLILWESQLLLEFLESQAQTAKRAKSRKCAPAESLENLKMSHFFLVEQAATLAQAEQGSSRRDPPADPHGNLYQQKKIFWIIPTYYRNDMHLE